MMDSSLLEILIPVIIRVITGAIGRSVAIKRGRSGTGGFLWGFFLGLIGVWIVSGHKKDENEPRIYYCRKCNSCYSGLNLSSCPNCQTAIKITDILLKEWQEFPKGKRDYLKKEFSMGRCFTSVERISDKEDLPRSLSPAVSKTEPATNRRSTSNKGTLTNTPPQASQTKMSSNKDEIIELRAYKELLDDGIITQEEFDTKKKQLLGL